MKNTQNWQKRTVLNWRWWVSMPILLLVLPLVALDLSLGVLAVIVLTVRKGIGRGARKIFDPLAKWIYGTGK